MNFKVGDGATWHIGSDALAGTIIEVNHSGKRVTFQRDIAKLMNGADSGEADALVTHQGGFSQHTSGRQRYEYSPGVSSYTIGFSLRRDGKWRGAGTDQLLTAGRHEHLDFNF